MSHSSPIPALHFLLGELPIEAVLHIRTLGLFHNIWSNPNTNVFRIGLYILMMRKENSTTWFHHIQLLCMTYGLPEPLLLMQTSPPLNKSDWNDMVKTRVTAWHERRLRLLSAPNSKMKYLNVELQGLTGRPHPALSKILNVQDVRKVRAHLKFLTLDFHHLQESPGQSSYCCLCHEDISCTVEHLIATCRVTLDIRSRMFPELVNVLASVWPNCQFLEYPPPPKILLQFILDPTSFNLPNDVRLPILCPNLDEVFRVSRDWCYAILMLYKRSNVP